MGANGPRIAPHNASTSTTGTAGKEKQEMKDRNRPTARRIVTAFLLAALMPVAGTIPIGAQDSVVMSVTADKTVREVAEGAGTFRTILSLLDECGLSSRLTGEEPITLLAPTDEAFRATLKSGDLDLLKSDKELMKRVVERHLIQGGLATADMEKVGKLKTIGGGEISAKAVESMGEMVPTIDGIFVQSANIQAKNGYFHVLPQVLLSAEDRAKLTELRKAKNEAKAAARKQKEAAKETAAPAEGESSPEKK